MQTIRLLIFCLLCNFPFTAFAEQSDVIPELPEEIQFCIEFSNANLKDFFDECITEYTNLDKAALDEQEIIKLCGEFSQAGMRECLSTVAKASHRLLEKFEEKRTFYVRSRTDPEYPAEMAGKELVANQAFYLYRDAYCAFDASLGGRVGMTMVYPRCIAIQNHNRVALLDKIRLNSKKMVEENLATPSVLLFSGRNLDKKCGWKGSKGGEADKCLRHETEESFQALKQAETEVFRAVASWDEHYHYIVAAKGKLILSNQVFYLYRDAHCAFEASLTGEEDSTRDTLHSICIAEINHWQASQLHKIALLFKSNPAEDK